MALIETFVRNPVKVAVGVLLVLLFGLIAMVRMPMQLAPEVQRPVISIETNWPGASPQEIEREIKIRKLLGDKKWAVWVRMRKAQEERAKAKATQQQN